MRDLAGTPTTPNVDSSKLLLADLPRSECRSADEVLSPGFPYVPWWWGIEFNTNVNRFEGHSATLKY